MAKRSASSKKIWYSRYPGDYGRKTQHLSLAEHGAYSLLMDYAYSNNGVIPAIAVQVHRICRAFGADEQAACMSVLHEFFELRDDGWHNDRIDDEVLKRGDLSEIRAEVARKRHAKDRAIADAKAGAIAPTITTTATDIGGDDSAGAKADDFLTPRELVLEAIGCPDGVAGPSRFIGTPGDVAELGRWLDLPGVTLDLVCEEIRRIMSRKSDGPPGTFKYFTRAMQELSGHLSAPQLEPIKGNGNECTPAYQPAQGGNARGRSSHQVMFDAFQSVASERSGRAGTDDFSN